MRGRQDDEEALFGPRFNLGDFRHLAAGYCRHLIRARLIDEPAFLDQRALARWDLGDSSRRESLTVDRLLHLAAQDLSLLNREFLPRCHSGGVEPSVTDTPVSRLIVSLAFLVPPTGAAPDLNSTLVELANQARRREPIDWANVFDAGELTAIRRDLDQLPHPPASLHELCCKADIVDVPGAEEQDARSAKMIAEAMQLAGASATRATYALREIPPFAPDAERCALMWVASIAAEE